MKSIVTGFSIILVAAFYVSYFAGSEEGRPRPLQPRLTPPARNVPPTAPGWTEVSDVITELLALAKTIPLTLGQLAWGFWAWLQTLPFWRAVGLVLLALLLSGLGWLKPVSSVEQKHRKMELKIRVETRQRGLF